MPRPDRSRPALVATAATLLRRQGYAATGLAQVLADSGATTGSLYHHFPDGKEQLAEAAIDAAAAEVTATLSTLLAAGDVPSAVAKWTKWLVRSLDADPRDGCPVAPVALESVQASDRLRAAAARAFTAWRDALAARLREDGRAPDAAVEDATAVLSLIEGALLLARTTRDPEPLRTAARAATRLLAR